MNPPNDISRLLITPGEPAGIGPDITIQIAQQEWRAQLVVIADPTLLAERAKQLNLPLNLITFDINAPIAVQPKGSLYILPVALKDSVTPGILNVKNAAYVMETLTIAADLCMQKKAQAVVTGPVHKGVINQANISFSGHTEFFAERAKVKSTVMLFVVQSIRGSFADEPRNDEASLKVALVTTHLALSAVPTAITTEKLRDTITLLHQALKQQFQIEQPHIAVCGLNPHAGENGYLGREEIDVITPTLNELNQNGFQLVGPLSADTMFTPKQLKQVDAVVAMYHDQALPLVKYIGFGHAVNMTLGLPFIRTSVDHGTALDVAGTGQADAGSMMAALKLALSFQHCHC